MIAVVTLMKPIRDFVMDRAGQADLTLMIHSKDGFKSFLNYTVQAEIQIINIQIEKDSQPNQEEGDLVFIAEMKLGEDVNKDNAIQHLKTIDTIVHVVEVKE